MVDDTHIQKAIEVLKTELYTEINAEKIKRLDILNLSRDRYSNLEKRLNQILDAVVANPQIEAEAEAEADAVLVINNILSPFILDVNKSVEGLSDIILTRTTKTETDIAAVKNEIKETSSIIKNEVKENSRKLTEDLKKVENKLKNIVSNIESKRKDNITKNTNHLKNIQDDVLLFKQVTTSNVNTALEKLKAIDSFYSKRFNDLKKDIDLITVSPQLDSTPGSVQESEIDIKYVEDSINKSVVELEQKIEYIMSSEAEHRAEINKKLKDGLNSIEKLKADHNNETMVASTKYLSRIDDLNSGLDIVKNGLTLSNVKIQSIEGATNESTAKINDLLKDTQDSFETKIDESIRDIVILDKLIKETQENLTNIEFNVSSEINTLTDKIDTQNNDIQDLKVSMQNTDETIFEMQKDISEIMNILKNYTTAGSGTSGGKGKGRNK